MAAGQLFDFERGLELGLVNQIFDAETHEQFRQQVTEYASQFTTPNKAAGAVAELSAACKQARRFLSSRRWRSSASCNSNSFIGGRERRTRRLRQQTQPIL